MGKSMSAFLFSNIFLPWHWLYKNKKERETERESAKIWKKKKPHRIGEEKITGKIRAIYRREGGSCYVLGVF